MGLRTAGRPCRLALLAVAVLTVCLAIGANSASAGSCLNFFSDNTSVSYTISGNTGTLTAVGSTEDFSVNGLPPSYDAYDPSTQWYNVFATPTDPDQNPGQFTCTSLSTRPPACPSRERSAITGALEDYWNFTPVSLAGLGNSGTLLQSSAIPSISSAGAGELRVTFDSVSGDVVPNYFSQPEAYIQFALRGIARRQLVPGAVQFRGRQFRYLRSILNRFRSLVPQACWWRSPLVSRCLYFGVRGECPIRCESVQVRRVLWNSPSKRDRWRSANMSWHGCREFPGYRNPRMGYSLDHVVLEASRQYLRSPFNYRQRVKSKVLVVAWPTAVAASLPSQRNSRDWGGFRH